MRIKRLAQFVQDGQPQVTENGHVITVERLAECVGKATYKRDGVEYVGEAAVRAYIEAQASGKTLTATLTRKAIKAAPAQESGKAPRARDGKGKFVKSTPPAATATQTKAPAQEDGLVTIDGQRFAIVGGKAYPLA